MQRVAIVGLHGAGKTTLALALGKATGLDVFQTDKMFLRPDGSVMPPEDQRARLDQVLGKPAYILEGTRGWTFAPRLAHCDTVIWVDIGFLRRVMNAVRRRRRAFKAHHMTGARKPLHGARFWGWFFLGHLGERAALKAAISDRPAGVPLIHLRSLVEVQAFLVSLQK